MIVSTEDAFWQAMAHLVASKPIVIDRPCGSVHPDFVELVYPLDYGYPEGTSTADGDGIDVWVGSQRKKVLTGIFCTYDTQKCDAEIKLVLGCTEVDTQTILDFNADTMHYLFIPNPQGEKL